MPASISARLITWGFGAVALLCLIVAGWLILTASAKERAKANAARAGQVVAEGRADAGQDAVEVVVAAGKRDDLIDQQTTENADAILNAPGADLRFDPGLDAATRRAICLRQSSRLDPACQPVQHPRPR